MSRDDLAWAQVQIEPVPVRRTGFIQTYLKEWPHGRHAAEARAAIESLDREAWRSALISGARSGDVKAILEAFQKGVDFNLKGPSSETALLEAAHGGRLDAVQVLISRGADPNVSANDGTTPLMLASLTGSLDVVRLLLGKGADVNAWNSSGNTALMAAAEHGSIEVIRALLAKDANPNATNAAGNTALMTAVRHQNVSIIRALLAAKADPCPKRANGESAASLASASGVREVASLFQAPSATCPAIPPWPSGVDGGRSAGAVEAVAPSPRVADTDGHRDAGAITPPPPAPASEAAARPRPMPQYAHILPGRGAAVLRRRTQAEPAGGARLPAFATVELLGPAADPAYTEVRTAAGEVGRVEAVRLGPGDGAAARQRWCEEGAGVAPVHNEIASKRRSGPHSITINNYGDQWAAVKMRDEGHRVVLSVLVGPRSTAEVKNAPSGRFRPEFAYGDRWSRRCGKFLDSTRAQRFPEFSEFPAPQPQAPQYMVMHRTYTITPVLGGNVLAQDIPADEFEAD